MASPGRPRLQAACMERLVGMGCLFEAPLVRAPRVYFAGDRLTAPILFGVVRGNGRHDRFDVIPIPAGPPYLNAFWRVLTDADPTVPLLFLENDVWCVEDFVPRVDWLVRTHELPANCGAISFFDFRNEASPGDKWIGLPPSSTRVFWGSQAILFPSPALNELARLARAERDFDAWTSWDIWIGRAVEAIGKRIVLHAPSWVQHLGTKSEVFPHEKAPRPVAKNFPEPYPTIEEDPT